MRKKVSFPVLITLALLSQAAYAQGGFYLTGALGSSDSDVDLGGINRIDGSDSSYAIGVGYTFNRNFSVEADYRSFGTPDGQTNCPPGYACILIPLRTEAEVTGISLSLIGSIPLSDRFNIYGRVGLLSWDVDFKGISSAFNDSAEDLLLGAGLDWSINDRWKLFAEYSSVDLDIGVGSVGARYYF